MSNNNKSNFDLGKALEYEYRTNKKFKEAWNEAEILHDLREQKKESKNES